MAQLVARFFPLGTRLSLPPGGLSLWLEFPAGVSTSALFTQALARGIRTAPGSMFSNSGRYEHCMRLRSEEHTSELQSPCNLVCRLLLEKKKKNKNRLNAHKSLMPQLK